MGYRDLSTNELVIIEEVNALQYALNKCGISITDMNKFIAEGLDKEFVEWFYSGNYCKYEDTEMDGDN